uniref:Protein THEM6 n=1 Tax=Timema genevievae TaxID=629358 RepID=A0A7R9JMT1_TIMGE|nr:unnamed protein product [Timema genevievae]
MPVISTLYWVDINTPLAEDQSVTLKFVVCLSVCLTSDVDIFLKHMNNARYIRELDFARFDFYFRCGLYEEIMVKSKGGNAMQGASNIRYRRTIPIFNPYKIETQLVYWDDKAIYLEQRFITLTDGFVRAVALSKQNIIGVSAEEMMKTLAGTGVKKPQVPQDLDHWLKSIEASSAKLRPKSD